MKIDISILVQSMSIHTNSVETNMNSVGAAARVTRMQTKKFVRSQ